MTWTEPDQAVEYWFMIKNEGHYDAYIAQSEFDKLVNINEYLSQKWYNNCDKYFFMEFYMGLFKNLKLKKQNKRIGKYGERKVRKAGKG